MSEKGHHLAGAVVSLGKESAGTKTGSGGAGTSRSWEPTALPCSHLPAFRSSSSISYPIGCFSQRTSWQREKVGSRVPDGVEKEGGVADRQSVSNKHTGFNKNGVVGLRLVHVAVGIGVSYDELPTMLWGCPFPPQPEISTGTKSEVGIHTSGSCVFCGPGPRWAFLCALFLFTQEISLRKRNTCRQMTSPPLYFSHLLLLSA